MYAQVVHLHPHLHAEGRQQRHRGRDPTHLPEGGAICLQEEHGEFRCSVILLCPEQDDSELLLMLWLLSCVGMPDWLMVCFVLQELLWLAGVHFIVISDCFLIEHL